MKLGEILKVVEPDTHINILITEIEAYTGFELSEELFEMSTTSMGDIQMPSEQTHHLLDDVSYIGVSEYGKGLDIGTIREVEKSNRPKAEKININQSKVIELISGMGEKDKAKILLALETVCNW